MASQPGCDEFDRKALAKAATIDQFAFVETRVITGDRNVIRVSLLRSNGCYD